MKNKSTYIRPLAVFVSFVLIFIVSTRKLLLAAGNIGHNWDWTFPALGSLLKRIVFQSSYAWNEINLGGEINLTISHLPMNFVFSFLTKFFSPKTEVLLLLFFVTCLAFYSFKSVLDNVVTKSPLNYALALLYAFSPFLFNDIIGGSWVMWLSFAFCPLYFLTVERYIRSSKIKYLLLSLLFSSFIIIALQNFVLINIIVFSYIFYEKYFLKEKISLAPIIRNTFMLIFTSILINFYWILPFTHSLQYFSKEVMTNNNIFSLEPITNSHQDIWGIITLAGYLDRNMYFYVLPRWLQNLMAFVVVLSWAGILVYFIRGTKSKKMPRFAFWISLLFVSIIIIKGGNQPFSAFTPWLYENLTLLRMFRSPQRLMTIAAFVVPILIAFFLHSLNITKNHWRLVALIALSGVLIWISGWWYSGDLGRVALSKKQRDHIDLYQLPPDLGRYYELANAVDLNYRTLFLPAVLSPLYVPNDYQTMAQGLQPEYLYLSKPTFISENNPFAAEIEYSLCSEEYNNVLDKLSDFSIKYIVVRSDISPLFTKSRTCWNIDDVIKKLDSRPDLRKESSGPLTTVYKLDGDYFQPIVTLVQPVGSKAVLEYKKINPTKYRLRFHQATSDFTLVLANSFNEGWKIYPANYIPISRQDLINQSTNYEPLVYNENFQPTVKELKEFINQGLVSDLGDNKSKSKQLYRYQDGRETASQSESYSIGFISDIISDTIQNDNLPNGNFFETWSLSPVEESTHIVVRKYANGWEIKAKKLCDGPVVCQVNPDKTFDFELIIEFSSQRLLYQGMAVSVLTLLVVIGIAIWLR